MKNMEKKKYCTTMNEMIQKYSHETPINESSENWYSLNDAFRIIHNKLKSNSVQLNETNIPK
jgi:hypothetical protein